MPGHGPRRPLSGAARTSLLAACLMLPAVATAGEAPPSAAEPAGATEATATVGEDRRTPCPEFAGDQAEWLERARLGVERSICVSAYGFDSLFGNDTTDDSGAAHATYGRLRLGGTWDERDGLGSEVRLRAVVPLPQLNQRLQAVVGRETDEEFIEDKPREFVNDSLFGADEETNWLVGLGYDPIRSRNSRLSLGVGVKLQSPLNPYAKASYRYYVQLADDWMARAQQTVFWENEDGLGTSTRAGLDWLLSDDRMLRWNNYLKLTEVTRGTYWNTSLTLYQRVAATRAVALRGGVRGETGREYSPVEYTLETIYRQPFARDWLFLEIRAGGGWLRTKQVEPREFVPSVAIVFEMLFGERARRSYADDRVTEVD